MDTKKSIIIIICYFGKFPWYFLYFLHSCKYNLDIDFVIITDNNFKYESSSNVRIVKRTLSEIKKVASRKLGFEAEIDFPYKLCDFKPAYGLIFSELIKGYDFWGYSDVDIILGDIRAFINNEILNNFDYISLRHDYTTGCFSLFRNSVLMRNIFKKSKDYKLVLSSKYLFSFDECNFSWEQLARGKSIFEIESEIESLTYVIKRAESQNEINSFFDFILVEGIPGRIKFDHGKIIYKNKFEGILYHLVELKKVYTPKYICRHIPDVFFISENRIYW